MGVRSGYKQTEVGEIPQDWNVEPIGQIAGVGRGRVISHREILRSSSPLYPVYSSQTKNDGVMGYLDTFDFEGDYITWTTDGANAGTVFARAGKFNCTNVCGTIKPRTDDHQYLARVLGRLAPPHVSRHLGNPKLMNDVMKKIMVPRPSLPEQRAIAEALSDVDALLSGLDRLIAKKRDLKQAAMQQLLTGQTRLPGFHGEWEVKRLGEICEISMGRTPARLNQAFWGRGHKWLSISDLQSKVVTESKEEITELAASTMKIVPKGTLLMSFKLSLGRLCFAGCDLFTNEAICSFNKLQADADFLYYALGRTDFSLYGKQAVKGYTLNRKSLELIEVTLPVRPEQTAIAQVLSDMDAELAALETRREKTRQLKQGTMQELLTGRTRLV